ncbi:MAG TPA: hypothetical protein VMP11_13565 [Verrucomicrobiae bacterium]|nr:hypothetical protein [Verrucomicrobiae bacterium]
MKRGITLALLAMGVAVAAWSLPAFADSRAPSATLYVYSGTIQSMDLLARTIIVNASESDSRKFFVPTDAEILVKETNPRGGLRDLMIGDSVQVKYTKDDGGLVAQRVSMLDLKAR